MKLNGVKKKDDLPKITYFFHLLKTIQTINAEKLFSSTVYQSFRLLPQSLGQSLYYNEIWMDEQSNGGTLSSFITPLNLHKPAIPNVVEMIFPNTKVINYERIVIESEGIIYLHKMMLEFDFLSIPKLDRFDTSVKNSLGFVSSIVYGRSWRISVRLELPLRYISLIKNVFAVIENNSLVDEFEKIQLPGNFSIQYVVSNSRFDTVLTTNSTRKVVEYFNRQRALMKNQTKMVLPNINDLKINGNVTTHSNNSNLELNSQSRTVGPHQQGESNSGDQGTESKDPTDNKKRPNLRNRNRKFESFITNRFTNRCI